MLVQKWQPEKCSSPSSPRRVKKLHSGPSGSSPRRSRCRPTALNKVGTVFMFSTTVMTKPYTLLRWARRRNGSYVTEQKKLTAGEARGRVSACLRGREAAGKREREGRTARLQAPEPVVLVEELVTDPQAGVPPAHVVVRLPARILDPSALLLGERSTYGVHVEVRRDAPVLLGDDAPPRLCSLGQRARDRLAERTRECTLVGRGEEDVRVPEAGVEAELEVGEGRDEGGEVALAHEDDDGGLFSRLEGREAGVGAAADGA